MAKKLKEELTLDNWNDMLGSFQGESDRGAAILVGSFVEYTLGQYLRFRIRDKKIAEELLSHMGSFAQRIMVAYAFDLISSRQHTDLVTILQVRNHFAHHPLDTTFKTDYVKQKCSTLSMFGVVANTPGIELGQRYRHTYLFTSGVLCADLMTGNKAVKLGDISQ